MFKKDRIATAALSLMIGLIIGVGISARFNLSTEGYPADINISKESVDTLNKVSEAMAEVTSAVKPAVVNIASSRAVAARSIPSPFFNNPFFRDFFGDQLQQQQPRQRNQTGLGSGVIVEKGGYILTNNHVVKDADDIKVRLSDKREFKGKIIGTDQKTDLAVIKIEADNLPVIKLGDSDKLKVGETVIAVGNPFGLNQTVTSGIVSAKGRADVGIADYEDFIQTDAAINPGNSGGALVNIKGEVIGINTAIFSTSGGYMGIGFAIPSNMARMVMDSLIKKGKVVRGWLGVSIQPVTAELGKQFGLNDEKGALVGEVVEGSPAEKAEIQVGDIIIEYDGREIGDPTSLRNQVAVTSAGRVVTLKVIRDGKPLTIKATIAEQSDTAQRAGDTVDNLLKGVRVQNLTTELKKGMGLPARIAGVVVADIGENSPAEGSLTKGDIIMQINRTKIGSEKDYEAVLAGIKANQGIMVLIYRNGSSLYITLSPK
ncbi:MAG: DegQ family serine endoprotease [Syntrophales bacterium LBB04]|nr:DegQ family serine endoprotease [Syntrophales bacterium LBB04]